MRSLAQPCPVNNTFFSLWEGQKWVFFPKYRTYRAFPHNRHFFLIAPRDLRYYWASAQPCAALRSLVELTTPFLASGKAKNGVFSIRIAQIASSLCFCTKRNFFRMVPEGLNAFGTFVHAAESAKLAFFSFLGLIQALKKCSTF